MTVHLQLRVRFEWSLDLTCDVNYANYEPEVIYGKWSVQASKQANIHMHGGNEVMLVWDSLRLAPTTRRMQDIVEQLLTLRNVIKDTDDSRSVAVWSMVEISSALTYLQFFPKCASSLPNFQVHHCMQ